jgi:thiamine transport system ATP-binding protein
MSLQLDQVTISLGTRQWCFDADLGQHGVYALLGASGSGKSTLLNVVGGYINQGSGHVLWAGEKLDALAPHERPVTTLFQSDNLFAHMSVADNIALGLDPRLRLDTDQRAAVEEVLKRVGLSGFNKRKPASLSGGERQRVGLARCLLRARPILLLDEPFGALDGRTRADTLALTRELITHHSPCVLMVTHDEDDATAIGADRLRVQDGKLHTDLPAYRRAQSNNQ